MRKAFLIAPSRKISRKNLSFARKRLKYLGFLSYSQENILSRYFYYAGSPKRRAQELNEAYKSSAEVIFSVLGGAGAVHILPYLDYDNIKKSNKILVGFSDITLLLNAIYQKTKTRCLHGPNLGNSKRFHIKTLKYLLNAINKENYQVFFKNKDILCEGKAKAQIIGGNLELLGRSLGTPFEIKTSGKVLFLEEYDMKSWRIFDILWQLKLAGKFDNIKGLILGHFTKCGKNINEYLVDFFREFEVPVIINQPIGHREPNLTIPLGEKCLIDTEKKFWEICF